MHISKVYLGGKHNVSIHLGEYDSFDKNNPLISTRLNYYTIGYTSGGKREYLSTRSKKKVNQMLKDFNLSYSLKNIL